LAAFLTAFFPATFFGAFFADFFRFAFLTMTFPRQLMTVLRQYRRS
jgi:hypothetical protein